eukprot:3867019-Amphidinium_carterae.1
MVMQLRGLHGCMTNLELHGCMVMLGTLPTKAMQLLRTTPSSLCAVPCSGAAGLWLRIVHTSFASNASRRT